MSKPLTPDQDAILRAEFEAGSPCRAAADKAGCGAATASRKFKEWGRPEPADVRASGSGDSKTLEGVSDAEVRSEEEAVAFFRVDLTRWRVKSWECGIWRVPMKMHRGQDASGRRKPDRSKVHTCYKVSLKLELAVPKPFLDATDALVKRLEAAAPKFDRPRLAWRPGGALLDVHIPDLHLGKLCWAPETGDNYDMRIAEEVYDAAVCDLLEKAKGFGVDRASHKIGSDFFHVDALAATTTAGTPQDMDGRYAKMIEIGEMAVIRAVDRLASECRRVDVIWVPGNHDRLASYHLARTVAAWFRHDDRVVVDFEPAVRKYLRFGSNLIGYTHGHKVKWDRMPLLMATERPSDWAVTRYRYIKTGHLHSQAERELMGVRFITSPALCGTDAYHYEAGYVGNVRAAEAYVHDPEAGEVARLTSVAKLWGA